MVALALGGAGPMPARAAEGRLDACAGVPTIDAPTQTRGGAPDMAAASVAVAQGERWLADDPDRALGRFEAALAAVPPGPGYSPMRARVLLQIVAAHEAATRRDDAGDLASLCRGHDRLARARALLDHYLGPLDLLDEEGRASVEARRAALRSAIAAARRRVLREEAIRDAAAARRSARVRTVAGALVLGGGGLGLGLMGAAISVGRSTDQQLDACPDGDPTCGGELMHYRTRGSAANVAVLGGALAGGVLVVTGAVLVIFGSRERTRARTLERGVRGFDLAPAPVSSGGHWGPGIVLRGRF